MGRYVPPEHEGIHSGNQLHKKLPPGRRKAGRNSDGQPQSQIQTVRFEMPFAVWCHGCAPPPTLIPQGVRFNAVKRRVGSYYTTPIWAFRIRHGACGKELEIHTDPKNTEYVVAEGGKRRDYGDGGSGAGPVTTTILGPIVSEEESERRRADAFAALEGRVEDRTAAKAETSRVAALRSGRDRDWEDPYAANRRIRRTFRAERKVRRRDEAHAEEIKDRFGLGIDLVAENENDVLRAKLVAYKNTAAEDVITSEGGEAEIGNAELSAAAAKPLFENKALLRTTRQSSSSSSSPAAGATAAAHDRLRGTLITNTNTSDALASKLHGKGSMNKGSNTGRNLSKSKLANLQAKLQGNTRAALDPFAVTKDTVSINPKPQSQSQDETDGSCLKKNSSSTPMSVSVAKTNGIPMTAATATTANVLPGLKRRNASESKSKEGINAADQHEAVINTNEVIMTAASTKAATAATAVSLSSKPQANMVALVDYESD